MLVQSFLPLLLKPRLLLVLHQLPNQHTLYNRFNIHMYTLTCSVHSTNRFLPLCSLDCRFYVHIYRSACVDIPVHHYQCSKRLNVTCIATRTRCGVAHSMVSGNFLTPSSNTCCKNRFLPFDNVLIIKLPSYFNTLADLQTH